MLLNSEESCINNVDFSTLGSPLEMDWISAGQCREHCRTMDAIFGILRAGSESDSCYCTNVTLAQTDFGNGVRVGEDIVCESALTTTDSNQATDGYLYHLGNAHS
jgi:hypothetical protein